MLRKALRFFSTSTQARAIGSPLHLQLHATLSEQLTTWRSVNARLAQVEEQQAEALAFRDEIKPLAMREKLESRQAPIDESPYEWDLQLRVTNQRIASLENEKGDLQFGKKHLSHLMRLQRQMIQKEESENKSEVVMIAAAPKPAC